jgi:ornithine cyclodeaminase
MKLIRIQDIKALFSLMDMHTFFQQLVERMQVDFAHWEDFQKSARYAAYADEGVLELMPVCGKEWFAFKYVNGHPDNPKHALLNIMALGMLAETKSGKPVLLSEMTLLTALRTAATSALGSKLLARPNSKKLAIIGCGAQSEFQVLAHHALFDLTEVVYFDLDPAAMLRFHTHLADESFQLTAATSGQAAIAGADIIITATAARNKQEVLKQAWLTPGQHISGIGGDSPGKTELDPEILRQNKVVVEYFPQTHHEGEIQNLGADAKKHVYAELWELCSGAKPGRTSTDEITVFDDVGFALEDYTILRYIHALSLEHPIGIDVDLIPEGIIDPKNLFGLLR